MLYEDTIYRKESEIDNAFPYLNVLDTQLELLKRQKDEFYTKAEYKKNIISIFKKDNNKNINIPNIIEKREVIETSGYKKDGYTFRVRLYKVYDIQDESKILYYEFCVNIKYKDITKRKQFYKKFIDTKEAKTYYKNMTAVFKNLKRRDLMERLFKEKEEEIENLRNWLINR